MHKRSIPTVTPWVAAAIVFLVSSAQGYSVGNQRGGFWQTVSLLVLASLLLMVTCAIMSASRCHMRPAMLSSLLFSVVGASMFMVESQFLWYLWVALGVFAGTSFTATLFFNGNSHHKDD